MLGKTISDPGKVESKKKEVLGLGLLNINTLFVAEKKTNQVKAKVAADLGLLGGLKDLEITGYEIHMGQTANENNPLLEVKTTRSGRVDHFDGALNENGLVFGTYLHGLFDNTEFLHGLINNLRKLRGLTKSTIPPFNREEQYDRLANLIRRNIDIDRLYKIIFE